ncbi:YkgJ family cysteine cluster protein [Catenovulum sediminis]|uniref:YkgJ family cysteine cluster protein n=1 Tax=Catenovulum sediminis TaxID=1740262 RepID=A0ABV1RDC1_9ALTE
MQCIPGCGACCIAPSITTPIPGMPHGKAAGERCVQLDENNLCKIFNQPERPKVCSAFTADPAICGDSKESALYIISSLESQTQ